MTEALGPKDISVYIEKSFDGASDFEDYTDGVTQYISVEKGDEPAVQRTYEFNNLGEDNYDTLVEVNNDGTIWSHEEEDILEVTYDLDYYSPYVALLQMSVMDLTAADSPIEVLNQGFTIYIDEDGKMRNVLIRCPETGAEVGFL